LSKVDEVILGSGMVFQDIRNREGRVVVVRG
jgi:hypothetical protein